MPDHTPTTAEVVMDALWPILGGNHTDADSWHAISNAVTTALAAMTPAPGEVGEDSDALGKLWDGLALLIDRFNAAEIV